MANSGKSVSGGDWSQRPETPKRQHQSRWRERDVDVDDIPAAGYSGHMPGLRQLGVGKSFNTAAREAKRDYAIRRRALSGDRLRVAQNLLIINLDQKIVDFFNKTTELLPHSGART
ncbi:hypothetical protein ANCDUO_15496 [Ancylostoma duodenale]|uniref:Uncharacterized protein n=1 Tax=Ancylostoma duodenale TaxID=51022 RepID=A0A0C2G644_9BILA|nr:hypothetical protein ANCDUO_15496 [Ancylostoma duodenale]